MDNNEKLLLVKQLQSLDDSQIMALDIQDLDGYILMSVPDKPKPTSLSDLDFLLDVDINNLQINK